MSEPEYVESYQDLRPKHFGSPVEQVFDSSESMEMSDLHTGNTEGSHEQILLPPNYHQEIPLASSSDHHSNDLTINIDQGADHQTAASHQDDPHNSPNSNDDHSDDHHHNNQHQSDRSDQNSQSVESSFLNSDFDEQLYVRTLSPWQQKLYGFFEAHNSIWAKLFMLVSYAFIVGAIITVPVQTLPQFTNSDGTESTLTDDLIPFQIVASTWWSIELLGRFLATNHKLTFFTHFLNFIDLLSILPVFFIGVSDPNVKSAVNILSVLRILKALKLAKYNVGIRVGLLAIRRSKDAVFMLLLFLILSLLITSTLMYWAERGQWDQQEREWVRPDGSRSPFNSIPEGFYWGITTLSTTGYGDTYPITPWGKFIASITMVLSIMTIALPTSIIGSNFMAEYQLYQKHLLQKKLVRNQRKTNRSKSTQSTGTADANVSATLNTTQSAERTKEQIKSLKEQNDSLYLALAEIQDKLNDVSPPQYYVKFKELKVQHDQSLVKIEFLEKELAKWKHIAKDLTKKNKSLTEYFKVKNIASPVVSIVKGTKNAASGIMNSIENVFEQSDYLDHVESMDEKKSTSVRAAKKAGKWIKKATGMSSATSATPTQSEHLSPVRDKRKSIQTTSSSQDTAEDADYSDSHLMPPRQQSLDSLHLDDDSNPSHGLDTSQESVDHQQDHHNDRHSNSERHVKFVDGHSQQSASAHEDHDDHKTDHGNQRGSRKSTG
ncbi:hypothetical protein MIR68_010073 [Amoeboaphelidium protococcarum]|nr:hypothetical protein MIR68_010073 [Amoeboaphelidium protococcarum]